MGSANVEFRMMRLCLHKAFHRGLGPPGWMACALTTQGEGEGGGGQREDQSPQELFFASNNNVFSDVYSGFLLNLRNNLKSLFLYEERGTLCHL